MPHLEDHTGQCHHCGATTHWTEDPSPDLCAMCAMAGRWSPLWGPDNLTEYLGFLRKLMNEREKRHHD